MHSHTYRCCQRLGQGPYLESNTRGHPPLKCYVVTVTSALMPLLFLAQHRGSITGHISQASG